MSVLAAAVTLAWGCLTVLTLAMAGMLRQLRELQTEVVQLRAEQGRQPWRATTGRRVPQLAGEGDLVLLVLDPGCGLCDAVHEPFTRLAAGQPGTRFEVLSPRASRAGQHWGGAPSIPSRIDPDLIAELELPWAPALLHVAEDGTVLAGRPITSSERISEQVAGLVNGAQTMLRQGTQ
ncbi:MAG: hypothetical protein ACRDRX_23905 [Pseudonocardiaceae bacterium]